MLPFSAALPFPAIDPSSRQSGEIFAHSAACDRWLGFQIAKIEDHLAEVGCRSRAPQASGEKQLIWIGLDPQLLQTPYTEIAWLLQRINPHAGQTVVDLGAAYGRMGFVLHRLHSEVNFLGFEYVGERVQEGRRALAKFGATRARLEHVDLASHDFKPPIANFYFLYDFGSPKAIEKILYDLRNLSLTKNFVLIVRGRHARYIIDRNHSWLANAFPGEPEARVSIYRSVDPVTEALLEA